MNKLNDDGKVAIRMVRTSPEKLVDSVLSLFGFERTVRVPKGLCDEFIYKRKKGFQTAEGNIVVIVCPALFTFRLEYKCPNALTHLSTPSFHSVLNMKYFGEKLEQFTGDVLWMVERCGGPE